MLAVAVKQTAL
jgi:hypothetical protein